MGVERLRDGTWFRRLVANHVRKHCASIAADHWDRRYPGLDAEARARAQIGSVARRAAVTGAFASVGASTGELLSLFTDGLAAPVGLPATVLSMAVEAAYTAMLQIDLVCDLASIYGVAFDPDDVGEVATLFGLALGLEVRRKPEEAATESGDDDVVPGGLTARLIELEDGEIATRIARKLLEDAVVKNIVPVLGLGIAARWNYVGTRRIAAAARKYVRYRRVLQDALARLDLSGITDPAVLVAGVWLLATVDGDAGHEEIMAVAAIMDSLPEDRRRELELDRALGDDEEQWFEDLARVPPAMHAPLLEVLYLVAATDKELQASERRFLRRVGKALGCEIDVPRIQRICHHLASGGALASSTPP